MYSKLVGGGILFPDSHVAWFSTFEKHQKAQGQNIPKKPRANLARAILFTKGIYFD